MKVTKVEDLKIKVPENRYCYNSYFYPVEDETVFCEAAKKHNILMVPASSFGCPGYVRIAYCVSYETIVNSLPHFAEVAKDMGL